MTELYAKVDVLEGELLRSLVGRGSGLSRRTFSVLTLTRDDGTSGVGEASPLPGTSRDDICAVAEALHGLVEAPLVVDPVASPFEIISSVFEQRPLAHPSARFAVETAVLDWLGQNRAAPVHRVVGGDEERASIPIADLMMNPDPTAWPREADRLVSAGATHLKAKVGRDFSVEVQALQAIRLAHPSLPLRLDGNARLSVEALRTHANTLESLELEIFEEPVATEHWGPALDLPLPWALDETLLDASSARRWLDSEKVRAVVLKPTVLGGFAACLEWAETAAAAGADSVVSHTFDGPIARAAAAELALVLQCRLAAGLGRHPALELWPACGTAAIEGRSIVDHDAFGLGLVFKGEAVA